VSRVRIEKESMVYFHTEAPYYRSMDALNKRGLLFLLTLVKCIILSMLIWIKGCKYLERIFMLDIVSLMSTFDVFDVMIS
jgi:hypothetical protein